MRPNRFRLLNQAAPAPVRTARAFEANSNSPIPVTSTALRDQDCADLTSMLLLQAPSRRPKPPAARGFLARQTVS